MPGFDGTGPCGRGTGTGMGRGRCQSSLNDCRMCLRGRRMRFGLDGVQGVQTTTLREQLEALKDSRDELEVQIKRLEKEIR
jgi:hypothetical protein